MKAVPKVNTIGLYLEDALVDDAFSGVVPFYAEVEPQAPVVPEEAEQEPAPEDEQPEETPEPEIAGYIVGVPVKPGLFIPRFDIAAWEVYQDDLQDAESDYRQAYDEWQTYPEDERGEPPAYVAPEMPTLWIEGLTPEEIEEITRPQPQEPTELELLAAVVEGIQQQNVQLQEAVVSSGEELSAVKTASEEQQVTLSALGSEQVKQDLSTLDLKQQNNVIGAELVKKDISILDLYMQNQVLGQMLAALELKILANGTGGESNVQQ
ncbi:hypothetical protein [Paenibacillus sp. FSL R5-808]|jgi:hypothetical protein|uniref:hypothetical protein n=1 Tax=Paenibacillus sp. FSL R5-808 TaxID=1227076 RepID=UPI0003E1F3FC|nr:hypothetical protein [Paenibacillus sp. FSL R5-808]ETT33266.1 hypothetical protein C169_22760 [Paenibacillus sp. FSL R5-808]